MTRATLLHVLDRPTALGPAEVRELEQLAQAFPYCQTAHLLLAKAAHDQGTMLAGQRLRRAATYAADRTLLRRLIEQVEPAVAEPEQPAALPAATVPIVAEAEIPAPAAPATSLERTHIEAVAPALIPEAEATSTPDAEVNSPGADPILASVAVPETLPEPLEPVSENLPVPTEALFAPAPVTAEGPFDSTVVSENEEIEPATDAAAPQAGTSLPPEEEKPELPALVDQEGVVIPIVDAAPALLLAPDPEEDLPAQAPAIRPPVEVGEARFEFGLAEPPPPAVPTTYELPGLVDEWAASAVTRSLGRPEPLAKSHLSALAPTPPLTPAAFTGDAAVGYAFGESSRLGFSLQLLAVLTANAEATDSNEVFVAAARPPAAPLPPAGAFFEPDFLLLGHWATHCPPVPALPSPLDLINNFLRRQPRLTRPAMLPPSPAAQADLSVRSTRAEPDLASESLARILVRQGKTARAIEIYEKLMVKQPEKMAYFASQIQQLQPTA